MGTDVGRPAELTVTTSALLVGAGAVDLRNAPPLLNVVSLATVSGDGSGQVCTAPIIAPGSVRR
jgi:hypothetical protein